MQDIVNDADIFAEMRGGLARVVLNRPKALNALTLPMIHQLDRWLAAWANDPAVAAVVLTGAGDRAFCAGGDIRSLDDAKRSGDRVTEIFFFDEYRFNRRIHRYPKPYISLIDGIVMGGGVGVSINGRTRVVTERALFAMPETGIGFFPDVGGSFFLSRCPGEIGMYLALTGARIKAADLIYAGLATHYAPHARLGELAAALERDPSERPLTALTDNPGAAPLAAHRATIDRCFAADSVEAIVDALAREGGEWAAATRATLLQKAPLSLKVTQRQIRAGARLDFEDCMVMEYRLSQRFMAGSDFFEGVRAVLVDKDNQPRWQPDRLEAVSDAMVEACFAPLGARDLTFVE
jgi:enoyl-CoA hydratase